MKLKVFCVLFVVACLSSFLAGISDASTSPTRTYQFHWDNGNSSAEQRAVHEWNVTAPIYASRGAPLTFVFKFHMLVGTMNVASMRFEVTAKLDNGSMQQIYHSIILQGTYDAGYQTTITPTMTVPSTALLGSTLNVSVYTALNQWFLFPTEIRDMNYDDLQSACDTAQSQVSALNQQINSLNQQIDTLNQQVTNLTNEKNTLNQQVNSLNQQVNNLTAQVSNSTQQLGSLSSQVADLSAERDTLNQQVASLNSQVASLSSQLVNETYAMMAAVVVAVVAIGVIAYLAVRKRKPSRPMSQSLRANP